jgi:hypothetical protein
MTLRRRESGSATDFLAMQALIQRTWPQEPRWHVGELAWSRISVAGAASRWRTALWWEDDRALAWGWAELPGELSLVVDPARRDLIREVLDCSAMSRVGVNTPAWCSRRRPR